jgi:hypothetical protein
VSATDRPLACNRTGVPTRAPGSPKPWKTAETPRAATTGCCASRRAVRRVNCLKTTPSTPARARSQRAIDELKAAEERIKALEVRALSAESRANEAEKWLVRLHDAIQEKLADGRVDDGRSAAVRPQAA